MESQLFSSGEETELEVMSQGTYDCVRESLPQTSQELNEYSWIENAGMERVIKIDEEVYHEFEWEPLSPYRRCSTQDQVAPQPLIENVGANAYTGRYNFRINFDKEEKPPTKSCLFTYSEELKRLFVQKKQIMQMKFTTSIEVPVNDTDIRACLLFKHEKDQHILIKQCPLHLEETKDPDNKNFVMQAAGNGKNIQCPVTQQYVTLSKLNISNSSNKKTFFVPFRFSCNSSCKGGINRKPIMAVFVLYVKGQQAGKCNLDISICTCPGRDRKNAEARGIEKMEKQVDVKVEEKPEKNDSSTDSDLDPHPKRFKSQHVLDRISTDEGDDDNKYYLIKIKGKRDAYFIKRIADIVSVMAEIVEMKDSTAPNKTNRGTNAQSQTRAISQNRALLQAKINFMKFERLKKNFNILPTILERSVSAPSRSRSIYKKCTVKVQQK